MVVAVNEPPENEIPGPVPGFSIPVVGLSRVGDELPPFTVRVRVEVPRPSPLGCRRWTTVRVLLDRSSSGSGDPNIVRGYLGGVTGIPVEPMGPEPRFKAPDKSALAKVAAFDRHLVELVFSGSPGRWHASNTVSNGRYVAAIEDEVLADPVLMEFRAPLVSQRAVGSCWVRLPAVVGALPEAANAEMLDPVIAPVARLDPHVPAPPGTNPPLIVRGRPSAGRTRIAGGLVNANDSRPAPNVASVGWSCTGRRKHAIIAESFDDCSGWAVIDAAWRQPLRDLSLIIVGVLLSLGVELWFRALDARRAVSARGGRTG